MRTYFLSSLVIGCTPFLNAVESNGDEEGIFFLAAGDSIAVSRYNATMQSTYDLVVNRCSTCHGMKDTVQSKEILPSYWEKTVPDMALKPNSGIAPGEVGIITDFLIYDSAKRRSAKLKRDLKALDPAQQQQEQAKIDAILQKYPD